MSKRKTGLFIAFGAALGAAAACVSYYLKYKSFHDELDRDFHDYEDEDELEEEPEETPDSAKEPAKRNYITIDAGKGHETEEKNEEPETGSEAPAGADGIFPENAVKSEHETAGSSADVTVEEDTDGEK